MREREGITLIALVITIAILLILATVAIGNIIGNGGLLDRAKEGAESYKINEIKEKMEIAKANEWMDSMGNITADGYFDQLEQEGIIGDKDADVEPVNEEEGIYNVTTDEGYIFEVTIDEDGNVEIEYVGKGEAVGPRVINIQVVNSTTSSVEIEVETIRAEGATYTYSYKKVSEDEYTVPEGQDNNSNRYNYTGLEANETYNFKVEVTDSEGRKAEGITNWTTATIPSGDEGIVVGEIEWSGGKASVTVSTNEEGYTLEYQKNEGGWQAVPGNGIINNLDHGDVVDIRLTDGTNYGEETTINIEDTEDPIIVEFKETTITESSIAVSVTASDNSGGTLTYEYKIGDGAYTAGTNTSTHTFEGLVAGKEYEMVVRVTDQAGRSVTKTLTKTTNAMPGKDTISVSLTSWANGQATITVSTTETGYKLKYQKNNDGNWIEIANGGTISGLVHGDAIDVILTNGISNSEELTFNVQDTEPPVISSFEKTGSTANSITVSVEASDNTGGTLKYEYKIGEGGYTEGSSTYEFTGLQPGQEYILEVKVTDEAGLSDTETITVTTVQTLGELVTNGTIAVGDYIKYSPGTGTNTTNGVFTMTTAQTGYTSNQNFNVSEYTGDWRILSIDTSGADPVIEIVSRDNVTFYNNTESALFLRGKTGYNNVVQTLNTMCGYYVNPKYAISGRSIGSDVNNLNGKTDYYVYTGDNQYLKDNTNQYINVDEDYLVDTGLLSNIDEWVSNRSYWYASRAFTLSRKPV